jgi:hypothetical protein
METRDTTQKWRHRFPTGCFVVIVGALLSLFAVRSTAARLESETTTVTPTATATITFQSGGAEEALTAITVALNAHLDASGLPYDGEVVSLQVQDDWASGMVQYTYKDTGQVVPTEPLFIVVHRDPVEGWQSSPPEFDTEEEYRAWLSSIPTSVLPSELREIALPRPQGGISTADIGTVSGYRKPWAGGWGATQTNNPGGHGYSAYDFNLWRGQWIGTRYESGYVVAAKSGTVRFAKDCGDDIGSHQGDLKYANGVIIDHGNNEYSWYWHLAHDSIPEDITVGTYVETGTVIGVEGNTGVSTDTHLHFMVSNHLPTLPFTSGCIADQVPKWTTSTYLVNFQETDPNYSENYLSSGSGVLLYWDADYKGPAKKYTNPGFRNVPNWFNDRASSIQISGPFNVSLYQHANAGGNTRDWWWTEANWDNDYYDPPNNTVWLNDSVSSVDVNVYACPGATPSASTDIGIQLNGDPCHPEATPTTPPPTPVATPIPQPTPVPSGWTQTFYSDTSLGTSCGSQRVETDTYVFRDSRTGWQTPSGCPNDNWSVRFTRSDLYFPGGEYEFGLFYDDGARLYVDGDLVVNGWWPGTQHYESRTLSAGNHSVVIEFYDTLGDAILQAWWRGPGYLPSDPDPDPNQWYVNYWGNEYWWKDAVGKRNEGSGSNGLFINHRDWGETGPGFGIPKEHYSVKFERTAFFECGTYRFHLFTDDGARVWMRSSSATGGNDRDWTENQIVPELDHLNHPQSADFYVNRFIGRGYHDLRVDYYQHTGGAGIAFDWLTLSPCNDNVPPDASISSPTTNDYVSGDNITIVADVSDSPGGSGIRNVTFAYQTDAGTWTTLFDDWDSTDSWSYDWNVGGLSDQMLSFAIYVTDNAGNVSAANSWGVALDRTPPSSAVSPLPATSNTNLIFVEWDSSDNLSGIQRYNVQYKDGADGVWTDWQTGISSNQTGHDFLGEEGHTYYFRAQAQDRAGNWSAYRSGNGDTYTTISSCTEDAYETDDSSSSASSIPTNGTPQTHNICGQGDQDWIKFNASEGNAYIVSTSNLGSWVDTYLELYGTDGETLLASDDNGGAEFAASEITWFAPSDGTYYVRARDNDPNLAGSSAVYDLAIAEAVGDIYEYDNVPSEANTIVVDNSAQIHNFHVTQDKDWAKFTATAGTLYVIQTSNLGINSDPYLHLYDNDARTELASDDDSAGNLAAQIVWRAPKDGTYFVEVEHYLKTAFGAYTDYDLSILSVDEGTPIGFDQTVEGKIFLPGQRDIYLLDASAGQWISVRMIGRPLDTYLEVRDSNDNLIAETDDKLELSRHYYDSFLTTNLPSDDTYQIIARSYGLSTGDYRLRLEGGREAAVGDVNRDCNINGTDSRIVIGRYGTDDQDADLNLDGIVNSIDSVIVTSNFRRTCAQSNTQTGTEAMAQRDLSQLADAGFLPKIEVVTPSLVINDIEHLVTITGSGFDSQATVKFDDIELSNVVYGGWDTITVTVPEGFGSGTYKVIVVNPDGIKASMPRGIRVIGDESYIYLPIILK